MIQRIVLMNINENDIEKVIEKSKQVLPSIPQVKSLQVGALKDDSVYNLALIILFENREDVKSFSPHPVHRDYVDNFLKPKLEDIKAYNVKIM
ncbi:MAG TPA: Dabb family protein [bacterium]|nr:Dabb family protein [bacterium]